jgi:hypothetical protein
MQTVTPYLLYEDGEAAIEFLSGAFGVSEASRAVGAASGLHAELKHQGASTPSGSRRPAAPRRSNRTASSTSRSFARSRPAQMLAVGSEWSHALSELHCRESPGVEILRDVRIRPGARLPVVR